MTDWALARGPPLPAPLALDCRPRLVVALQESLEGPLDFLVPQTIDRSTPAFGERIHSIKLDMPNLGKLRQ